MSEFKVETNIGDLPRRLLRLPREVRQELLEDAAETAQKRALELFRRTVRTWRRKPTFRVDAQVRPTLVRIEGGTNDPIYGYVDLGTRPHIIEPKGEGYPLRFQSAYQAKTIPGVLASRPGGPSGRMVHAYRVRHPGNRPRRFSAMIAQKTIEAVRSGLAKRFGEAVRRGFQRIRL